MIMSKNIPSAAMLARRNPVIYDQRHGAYLRSEFKCAEGLEPHPLLMLIPESSKTLNSSCNNPKIPSKWTC